MRTSETIADSGPIVTTATASPKVSVMSTSFSRFSAAELEDARMTYLTNYNHRTMNCGHGSAEITTVVGTSRFQDSLRGHRAPPMASSVRPTPARTGSPRSKRADNCRGTHRWQHRGLSRQRSGERHLAQLHELERARQYLVCSDLLGRCANVIFRLRESGGSGIIAAGFLEPTAGGQTVAGHRPLVPGGRGERAGDVEIKIPSFIPANLLTRRMAAFRRISRRRAPTELLALGFQRVEFTINQGTTRVTLHRATRGAPTSQFNAASGNIATVLLALGNLSRYPELAVFDTGRDRMSATRIVSIQGWLGPCRSGVVAVRWVGPACRLDHVSHVVISVACAR